MGQRGKSAAFMPNKFVFPGGAVDPSDAEVGLYTPLSSECWTRLTARTASPSPEALALAAIREVWEETGLRIGAPLGAQEKPDTIPEDWQGFFKTGLAPSGEHLRFVFRAITPPLRPRRFDARFFMINADHLMDDLDDFTEASDELSHLQWIPLEETQNFDLPRITQIVMREVIDRVHGEGSFKGVPFYDQTGGQDHKIYYL